uniref:Uncharacterized protein n=1 Tax=Rhizophora mucronata TaxID=61149 RepID=A0A2P2L4B9_RHIMU
MFLFLFPGDVMIYTRHPKGINNLLGLAAKNFRTELISLKIDGEQDTSQSIEATTVHSMENCEEECDPSQQYTRPATPQTKQNITFQSSGHHWSKVSHVESVDYEYIASFDLVSDLLLYASSANLSDLPSHVFMLSNFFSSSQGLG